VTYSVNKEVIYEYILRYLFDRVILVRGGQGPHRAVELMMMMMIIIIILHGYEKDEEFPVLYANPQLHYHVHNISATRPQFSCINLAPKHLALELDI